MGPLMTCINDWKLEVKNQVAQAGTSYEQDALVTSQQPHDTEFNNPCQQ
jgi:hypothetical protein